MKDQKEPLPKTPQQRVAERLKYLLRESAAGTAALSLTAGLFLGCDPLPEPPFRCSKDVTSAELFEGVNIRAAEWQSNDGGARFVHASLGIYAGTMNVAFPADPHITGGTLLKVVRNGGSIELDFVPDVGVQTVQIQFHVDCNMNHVLMDLVFDVSKTNVVTVTAVGGAGADAGI